MEHNRKDPDETEGTNGRPFSGHEGFAHERRALARPRNEMERVISLFLDVSHSGASPPAVPPCLLMDREEAAVTVVANSLVSMGCASILGADARSNRRAIPRSVRTRHYKPLKFQVIARVRGSDGR